MTEKLKEYDTVISLNKLSDKVSSGLKGVILIVHESEPPAYEVEFLSNDGDTIDVLTVEQQNIKKIDG